MEVSEKDIETLREAIDGCGGSSYTQALAILDRLSPAPEPEVDEATVWTRTVFDVLYPMIRIDPGFKSGTPLERVRAVIAELIASKDAEIAKLTGERDRQYDDNVNRIAAEGAAIVRAEKAESERAALRAENERLKARDMGACAQINELKADCARLQQALAIQEGVSDTVHEALWAADKAAERNTAEPAKGIPDRDHSDAKATDALKEAVALSRNSDVVVTDSDWTFARTLNAELFWAPPASTREKVMANFAAKYRIEAEARGRREALEAATARLEWYRQYGAGMIDQRGFAASLIAELKRMMTGGK